MNETHETQVSIRWRWVITLLLLCMIICSVVSYRLGKRQAYKEILEDYFSPAIAACLCFDAYQLHEKY